MKKGIMLGLGEGSPGEAAIVAKCSRSTLRRQLNRCLQLDENGCLIGWYALWPHARINPYRRTAALPNSSDLPRGTAGSFNAFLLAHPRIRAALEAAISLQEPGLAAGGKNTSRAVFQAFIRACKQPSENITNNDYPFCTKSYAKRTVQRFVKRYLEDNASKTGSWYGESAVKRTRLGKGIKSPILSTQPLDEIEIDAHRMDAVGVIIIPGPRGLVRIPVERLWLIAAIDRQTHAAIGYSLATTIQPSAVHIEEAMVCANTPWTPKKSSFSRISYLPGAGLPCGIIKELNNVRPARVTLDNAMQHFSGRIVNGLRRNLGCSIEWGEVGAWWHNHVIERFFKTLESYGFRGLSSSTGTGPQDPCRKDPVANAIKDGVEQSELIDLMDVLLSNYNATPSRPLGNQSPLELISSHINSVSEPWLPRIAPPVTYITPELGSTVEYVTVRGSLKTGRSPYIQCDEVEYNNTSLSKRYDLIGTKILLQINELDMRSILAFEPKSGEALGVLTAGGRWSEIKHTRMDRKSINSLRLSGELRVDAGENPLLNYREHLFKKSIENISKNRKPTISHSASLLAKLSETTGLPVTPQKQRKNYCLNTDEPSNPIINITEPDWSFTRKQ